MILLSEEVDIASIIIDSINSIFNTIFSSVDTDLCSILDHITFVDSSILNNSYFSSLFGNSSNSGILIVANAFIFGFILYYAIKLLLSHLLITQTERPISFLFKLLFFTICMNSSIFLCERILFFNSSFSLLIQEIGENFINIPITFSSLFDKIHTIISIEQNNFNLFSIDGILKSFLSVSLINLTFSYSLRYILIKVFILLSPFAFLSLCMQSTSYFFKAWLKCFLLLLFLQIFVAIVLIILFSMDFNPNQILSKFLICGAIFALTKANSFIKEFLGGISTDISVSFKNFSSFLNL